jgi:hypothetical protein
MGPAGAATLAMTAGAITVEHLEAVPRNLASELAERDPVNWAVFVAAYESNSRGGHCQAVPLLITCSVEGAHRSLPECI